MLSFVKDLAYEGGRLALRLRRDIDIESLRIDSKDSEKDLVTAADRQVEDYVIERIRREFPDHGILAEESGHSRSASPYRWVIDPIDGTASYIHNQPGYSVSIALQYQGRSRFAAIYVPVLGELYHAQLGAGAYCDDRSIKVVDHGDLRQSHVATGFSCLRAGWKANNLPYFCDIAQQAREVRRYGSAALDLCLVAAGKIDAFWELNLQPYDVAAGALLVTEAGGEITDLNGADNWPEQGVLASNGVLHSTMLEFFKGYQRTEACAGDGIQSL